MPNKYLLRKYLDGHCTNEETVQVEAYLADDHSDFKALSEAIGMAWDAQPEVTEAYRLKAELLNRLHEQFQSDAERQAPVVGIMQSFFGSWTGWAAAVLVGVLLTGMLVYFGRLAPHRPGRGISNSMTWTSVVNNSDSMRLVVLPDESKVYMAPRAGLSYALAAEAGERAVRLDGEAFFDVHHEAARPFRVYTGPVCTEVLGTAFNVEGYKREDFVKVSLVRGRVKISRHGNAGSGRVIDTLLAGQLLTS